MHDRISVSGLCFPAHDLRGTLEQLETVGAGKTTLTAGKFREFGWDLGTLHLGSTGIEVVALIESPLPLHDRDAWMEAEERFKETLHVAASLSIPTVYLPSGPRAAARWSTCIDLFLEAMSPVLEIAHSVGVRVAVEPTNWLYSDLSFVHSLRDGHELAQRAEIGICADLFHIWTDANLEYTLVKAAEEIALVQVSDYVFGDRGFPCRAVPGDGGIPLKSVLRWCKDASYSGIFDIELSGPRIDEEGHVNAARRAVRWLSHALAED